MLMKNNTKSKKYRFIFVGLLLWIFASFFLEKGILNIMFSIVSISFLALTIYDLIKNNLMLSMPSLIEGIIDVIGLVAVVSGVFVEVDNSNAFVYVLSFVC